MGVVNERESEVCIPKEREREVYISKEREYDREKEKWVSVWVRERDVHSCIEPRGMHKTVSDIVDICTPGPERPGDTRKLLSRRGEVLVLVFRRLARAARSLKDRKSFNRLRTLMSTVASTTCGDHVSGIYKLWRSSN